jgi:hypothetical protein
VNVSSNAVQNSFNSGLGGTSATGTYTLGVQFTPLVDIIVYGIMDAYSYSGLSCGWSCSSYGYVRIWDTANQADLWDVFSVNTSGTWQTSYSSAIKLTGGHTYMLTYDANGTTYTYGAAQNPTSLISIGGSYYATAVSTYPTLSSGGPVYSGVGLYYYPVAYQPVHLSYVFPVSSAGTQTYYLNGTQDGPNTYCSFDSKNMSAVFMPSFAQ